jgi:hexosaminidase
VIKSIFICKSFQIKTMMRGVVLLALIVAYCIARPKSTTFVKPPTVTTRINDVPRVNLWPQPNSVVFNPAQNITAIIPKYKSFQFTIQHAQTVAETNILKDNFKRYQELFFLSKIDEVTDACTGNVVCLTELRVNIASTSTSDPVLEYSSDESYSITVDKQIIITSQTVWGAIRALETVSQLIQVAMTAKNQPVYALRGYTVPLQIDDAPRFHWRGLLVDTSRHYISVDKLLHILDSLSYIKMNGKLTYDRN